MARAVNVNVGVLGHVDSGKTSLVKALSTSLSTAALDKHPQSQQRGITLDLGFSAFSLPLPEHLLTEYGGMFDLIQFTLVDCPGHASLIKTIIGGAQIIDMIILVVDANKGIQTQTAECIVIGEMTTDNLIIVLNKIDAIPEEDREEKLERVSKRVRAALSTTKFKNAPIVKTAAFVGGEKVAAVTTDGANAEHQDSATASNSSGAKSDQKDKNKKNVTKSIGIDTLTDLLKNSVRVPNRNVEKAPFYFAVDHCFPIKGHGTVLTGTVLSGSVSTNATIELPYIQQQRKVKSMQMFRKPVKEAGQGDRVGICVTSLDAANIERGIAAAPGSVPLLSSVICMVKKVRYFRGAAKSNAKFHVSIGHTTVLATTTFFGAKELALLSLSPEANEEEERKTRMSSLNTSYHSSFPRVDYDWSAHYEVQDELYGGEDTGSREDSSSPEGGGEEPDQLTRTQHMHGREPVQWALLHFQQPVYCPLGSLIIGSRLDIDTKAVKPADKGREKEEKEGKEGSNKSCRLTFHGPIVENFSGKDVSKIQLFTWKGKDAEVFKHSDVRSGGMCYELVAHKLYSEGASITPFIGMKLLTASNHAGVITASFGSGGKFKVKFPEGVPRARAPVGSKLLLRFKRFVNDKDKFMRQFAKDFEGLQAKETESLTNASKVKEEGRPKKEKAKDRGEMGKEKATEKSFEDVALQGRHVTKDASGMEESLSSEDAPRVYSERQGTIDSLKEGGVMAIVSGIFTMADDIRSHVGAKALGPDGEEGELVGPYAKLGKCKIRFQGSIAGDAGGRVTLKIFQ